MTLTIPEQLRRHARYRPQKTAVIDRERAFSYAQLDRMVDGAAHRLAAAGVVHGQVIGVALRDRAEHLVALLALGRMGAIVLPLDPRWTPAEIENVSRNFGAATTLFDQGDARHGAIRVMDDWFAESDTPYRDDQVTLDTPMVLSLSSGTTGMPKGPLASHGKFIARFALYWLDLGLSGRDRFVTATPLYFGGGRGFALAMIYAGGTSALFCPPYKSQELIDFVNAVDGTSMFLVPTLLKRLLAERDANMPIAFPGIDVLISSGSAIYASEQREVRARLSPNLFQYYSSTEGGGCSLLGPEDFERHPDSIGQPCFGVDVEVVDADHRPVAPGDVGRLRYRSAASAENYHAGDESAAFHDGWFYPGDLGSFDEDGFLYLRGRVKDMIIRGGVNIYPNDIEAVIAALPGVTEVAVTGLPNAELGEEVAAFVVTAAGAGIDMEKVRVHCVQRLARYKVPNRYFFRDELPKAGVGKVDKAALLRSVVGIA